MLTAIEQIDAIQERLDKTKSDPIWINEALAELRETVKSGGAFPGLNLNLEGFAGIGFTDMAACAALTGLIERWEDEAVFHMGDIDSEAATASMKRLAMWATTTGEFMAYEKRRRKAAAEAAAVAAQAQAEEDAPDQASNA